MAKGFKHGAGGGTPLNFKIVGNPQPETAKENTIWLNTDVEITSWIFSATEPETAAEGMVWISVGTSSPVKFNALKKNGIMVYPLSAKQYVDGAWVTVEAKTYQGGEWVEWGIYLFREGAGALVNFSINRTVVTITTDGIIFSGAGSKGLYNDDSISFVAPITFCVDARIDWIGDSNEYIGALVAKTPSVYNSTFSDNNQPATATARLNMIADSVRRVYRLPLSVGTYHLGLAGNIKGAVYNMWYE